MQQNNDIQYYGGEHALENTGSLTRRERRTGGKLPKTTSRKKSSRVKKFTYLAADGDSDVDWDEETVNDFEPASGSEQSGDSGPSSSRVYSRGKMEKQREKSQVVPDFSSEEEDTDDAFSDWDDIAERSEASLQKITNLRQHRVGSKPKRYKEAEGKKGAVVGNKGETGVRNTIAEWVGGFRTLLTEGQFTATFPAVPEDPDLEVALFTLMISNKPKILKQYKGRKLDDVSWATLIETPNFRLSVDDIWTDVFDGDENDAFFDGVQLYLKKYGILRGDWFLDLAGLGSSQEIVGPSWQGALFSVVNGLSPYALVTMEIGFDGATPVFMTVGLLTDKLMVAYDIGKPLMFVGAPGSPEVQEALGIMAGLGQLSGPPYILTTRDLITGLKPAGLVVGGVVTSISTFFLMAGRLGASKGDQSAQVMRPQQEHPDYGEVDKVEYVRILKKLWAEMHSMLPAFKSMSNNTTYSNALRFIDKLKLFRKALKDPNFDSPQLGPVMYERLKTELSDRKAMGNFRRTYTGLSKQTSKKKGTGKGRSGLAALREQQSKRSHV